MTTETLKDRSVRELRRRAALARSIVRDNSGPLQRALSVTRAKPVESVAFAVGVGILLSLLTRRR